MTTLNAHFDGRVFVPDEPVNLPVGKPVKVVLAEGKETVNDVRIAEELPFDIHPETGFPMFRVPPGTPQIRLEEIQKAQDEF